MPADPASRAGAASGAKHPGPLLSDRTLDRLPADVSRPRRDRTGIRSGVVHLGLGNFARAHLLPVFDTLAARGAARPGGDSPAWGVTGVSLRSPAVRDRLSPQDHLYTLRERAAGGDRTRLVTVLREVLVAPERPDAVLAALCRPETHLVTLTITEKGYGQDPASGEPDLDHPGLRHDLAHPDAPRTAPGLLAAALRRRLAAGVSPFVTLSCDNLSGNGRRLRAAVLLLLSAHDPAAAASLSDRAPFPDTMVDRIVPATDDAALDAAALRLGLVDRGALDAEAFSQWVIARHPAAGPVLSALATVPGVVLADDVSPWERAKLRLLNGAHILLACLGGLHDVAHVHEAVAVPPLRRAVLALWDEAEPTLRPTPPGLDLPAYRDALLRRFADPSLPHRLRQIAADGSAKLPPRILAPATERLDRGLPVDAAALAVAAWMRWQSGVTLSGARFAVDDPLADATAALLAAVPENADPEATDHARVSALLTLRQVFPPRLAADPAFTVPLRAAYRRLRPGAVPPTLR